MKKHIVTIGFLLLAFAAVIVLLLISPEKSENADVKAVMKTLSGAAEKLDLQAFSEITDDPDDPLMLVNKVHWLSKDYEPSDLVDVSDFAVRQAKAKKSVKTAYQKLYKAAAEEGYDIRIVSAYRDYKLQAELFAYWTEVDGLEEAKRTSAEAGRSEHQTGYALDVSCASEGWDLQKSFGDTPEGKWLAENCHKYGFIIRYQKDTEDITGYAYEPWHIRYVGKKAAKEISERNLPFETYYLEYLSY